jgi:hypothetical protein
LFEISNEEECGFNKFEMFEDGDGVSVVVGTEVKLN